MAPARSREAALDVEKLAKQAAALAVLRNQSVVIGGYEIKEALWDLLEALRVDEDAVDYDDVVKALDRYRVYAGEESDSDIFIIANYDVKSIADSGFIRALLETSYNVLEEAVEKYLSGMLSGCTTEWSSAREALRRSEDAGFEIYVTHEYINSEYEGYIEYTVKAPTGEEFKIYKNIDYCNYCIHNGASIGIQKCVSYTWEKDERWAKQEELQ
ncbi:hypothetical protein [Pyrobaculum sp.]|uniref:hypothetical protein n=1 Tax=Pyrobaculum sp. TaxID=2004705 RepID=UPI003D12FB88